MIYAPAVALFTRAWIEMVSTIVALRTYSVALFTRAWIEMIYPVLSLKEKNCRPLHEGVD